LTERTQGSNEPEPPNEPDREMHERIPARHESPPHATGSGLGRRRGRRPADRALAAPSAVTGLLVLLAKGVVLGLSIAAPIGPMALLTLRTTLAHGLGYGGSWVTTV
jgi:hypothetical protein